ncbi:hypothetical protein AB0B45_01370 [Nonomuraea sp. NPDC049152]|uniref:hypothetical protein n=1 Tax=Nonomuraea sp. NPDC049152 TaxID=3154350 RepID=UPI00340EE428
MTTTQIWQPHDQAGGELRMTEIPAGRLVMEATSTSALTWNVRESPEGVQEVLVRPAVTRSGQARLAAPLRGRDGLLEP